MTMNKVILIALGMLSLSAPAVAQDAAAPVHLAQAPAQIGDADGGFVAPDRFSEPSGEKIYRRVCAGCHMADAKGATGAGTYPSLAANKNLASAGYPLAFVLHGRNGMPAIGRMLTDAQVAEVVNYVRGNFGNKYKDKITAADAKAAR